MPRKYQIKVETMPSRYPPVPKFSSFETEGCLGCLECVKRTSCVYDVYGQREFDASMVVDTGDAICLSCLRCVQECKKNILTRALNPQFEEMGDDYWKPDQIASIWKQAETGQIPVSGAGYNGPFSGPGFDQMWTDMSEIVRPTRDGIHGREYISTVIELGRRPETLEFDKAGNLVSDPPPFIELPIPIIFDTAPFGNIGESTRLAIVKAAKNTGTMVVATLDEARKTFKDYRDRLVLKLKSIPNDLSALNGITAVEIADSEKVMGDLNRLKSKRPDIIACIRLPLDEHAAKRAAKLALQGAEVIHLEADYHGQGLGARRNEFITKLVREVHLRLVEDSIREQVTVLHSGGIAMAEHVAKTIICGADGVGIDLALLVALECRLCKRCTKGLECPVELDKVPAEMGAQRITNLIGSWHSQIIEVLGAMGLREVRRLRGEVGRAMFFDDLESQHFSPIFGEQIQSGKSLPAEEMVSRSITHKFPLRNGDQIKPCPSRFRNALSKFLVVRNTACIACGKCAEVCAYGVHHNAGKRMLKPRSIHCVGPEICRANDAYCGDHCPVEAVSVGPDPAWKTFGDPRWTADLIVSTWIQAETGMPPEQNLEYRVGASGGGFDRIHFNFPDKPPDRSLKPEEIDLSIPLNRRNDGRPEITIGFPAYGGGMSFGSISLTTMLARARAWKAFGSFTCTGEGGYPRELEEYNDHVITQVATGLFGVREETIQRVRMVEFKYAQGAKPGLGGHLLGDKVTSSVARMRETVEGSALFSPFPFHSVYSVEDHKKHVDWIKVINPRALVLVKVSTPCDVDMVAVGSYYAGAHVIHLDGSYGGTGASPDIAKKNIAMPIEYAIPLVHKFLCNEGVRDQMTLIASGGLRSAWDIAKTIALGADGVVLGTSELVALECIRCMNCESGRGCPRSIATTDPELAIMYDEGYGTQRLINLFHSYAVQLQDILWRLGMKSIRDLVGRTDLLIHEDYKKNYIERQNNFHR